jgi:hypothetical protein
MKGGGLLLVHSIECYVYECTNEMMYTMVAVNVYFAIKKKIGCLWNVQASCRGPDWLERDWLACSVDTTD